MTLEQIEKRATQVKERFEKNNTTAAYILESILWKEVLTEISRGNPQAEDMASIALQTRPNPEGLYRAS